DPHGPSEPPGHLPQLHGVPERSPDRRLLLLAGVARVSGAAAARADPRAPRGLRLPERRAGAHLSRQALGRGYPGRELSLHRRELDRVVPAQRRARLGGRRGVVDPRGAARSAALRDRAVLRDDRARVALPGAGVVEPAGARVPAARRRVTAARYWWC